MNKILITLAMVLLMFRCNAFAGDNTVSSTELFNGAITVLAHLIIKGVAGYSLFKLFTNGLSRHTLSSARQQGRWLAGWLVGVSILTHSLKELIEGNYLNFFALLAVQILVSLIIGYALGFIWFKFKKYRKKINIKIDEKYWALAEKEFNADRKTGLWAELFSEAKGDENLAKAHYLKKRATQIASEEKPIEPEIPPANFATYDNRYQQINSEISTDLPLEDRQKLFDYMAAIEQTDPDNELPVKATQNDEQSRRIKSIKQLLFILIVAILGFYIKNLVHEQDPLVQVELGNNYYFGKNDFNKDYKQAFDWYKKSAEQSYTYAQYSTGFMYSTGQGVTKDDTQAYYWFKKAAEQGNADAQLSLGNMYFAGNVVEKNYETAFYWRQKSAEQGNVTSQFLIGSMYESGNGVIKNYSQALAWYIKASEQGNADASWFIGDMYEKGNGVNQDLNVAENFYRKSESQGNKNASNLIKTLKLRKLHPELF